MKLIHALLATLSLALAIVAANAQTTTVTNMLGDVPLTNPTISGGLQQIYDAALGSTNYAIAVGGGRGLKGNHNLVFVDYLYNFNANAGLILGFDDIAGGNNFTTDNISFIKGGFNIQAEIAPLKSIAPNFKITPFASLLMSSSGGEVGEIVVAGGNYQITIAKGWKFNLGGFYENRTGGNTATDGAYICGHLALSRNF
jgi:hypothetical protein